MINTAKLKSYRDAVSELDPKGSPTARILKEPLIRAVSSSARCLVVDASFNPPTRAHWALGQESAAVSKADTILLQLSGANVDKGIEGPDLGQRLLMVAAESDRDPRVGVSICSHARFIDKAAALSRLSPETRFVFAIGYDTLVRLFDPKYYRDMTTELEILFGIAEFAVANRGENDLSDIEQCLDNPALEPHKAHIHQVTLVQSFAEISSSGVREAILRGLPYSDSISPEVSGVIDALDLYKK